MWGIFRLLLKWKKKFTIALLHCKTTYTHLGDIGVVGIQFHSFLTEAVDRGKCSASSPTREWAPCTLRTGGRACTRASTCVLEKRKSLRLLELWHYVEFRMKNYYQVKTNVKYKHKNISYSTETKFLGLIIDETLSWKQHIDQIATKLCSACYALRNLKHTVPQSTLRTIYYAHVHSILSYDSLLGEIP